MLPYIYIYIYKATRPPACRCVCVDVCLTDDVGTSLLDLRACVWSRCLLPLFFVAYLGSFQFLLFPRFSSQMDPQTNFPQCRRQGARGTRVSLWPFSSPRSSPHTHTHTHLSSMHLLSFSLSSFSPLSNVDHAVRRSPLPPNLASLSLTKTQAFLRSVLNHRDSEIPPPPHRRRTCVCPVRFRLCRLFILFSRAFPVCAGTGFCTVFSRKTRGRLQAPSAASTWTSWSLRSPFSW